MTAISSPIPLIPQAAHLGALRYYPLSEILHLPRPGHHPLLLHCPEEVEKRPMKFKKINRKFRKKAAIATDLPAAVWGYKELTVYCFNWSWSKITYRIEVIGSLIPGEIQLECYPLKQKNVFSYEQKNVFVSSVFYLASSWLLPGYCGHPEAYLCACFSAFHNSVLPEEKKRAPFWNTPSMALVMFVRHQGWKISRTFPNRNPNYARLQNEYVYIFLFKLV